MLVCVHVVQTNNNESNWRKKKKTNFYCKQTKKCELVKKKIKKIKFNIVNKIHKELM